MGDTILQVDDIQKFYGNKGNLTKAMRILLSFLQAFQKTVQIEW